jgi:hypothetical protein
MGTKEPVFTRLCQKAPAQGLHQTTTLYFPQKNGHESVCFF